MPNIDPRTTRDPLLFADHLLHRGIDPDDLSLDEILKVAEVFIRLADVHERRLANLIEAAKDEERPAADRTLLKNVIHSRLRVLPPKTFDGQRANGGD